MNRQSKPNWTPPLGLINRAKTHCRAGHEFNAENTRVSRGRRHCRACLRQWAANHRPKRPSILDRLLSRRVIGSNACWLWTGSIHRTTGYGSIGIGRRSLGDKKTVYVHRVSYELYKGPIPHNYQIDHLGLGKTLMQLETLRLTLAKAGGNALIVCPLGVRQEFKPTLFDLVAETEEVLA